MNLRDASQALYFGRHGPNNRPPKPAGHPETWGAITRGTCLEGSPYPFPVYDVEKPEAGSPRGMPEYVGTTLRLPPKADRPLG